MNFNQVYEELQWFFSLGYVIIISTILTMLLVKLFRVTILKKSLLNATDNQKDQILGMTGTITSLVVYGLVYIGNEMIVQMTFFIKFDEVISPMTITSGAAVTWVAAKGLYTVLHKFKGRLADKKLTKKELEDTKADIDEVKKSIEDAVELNAPVITNPVGAKPASNKGKIHY